MYFEQAAIKIGTGAKANAVHNFSARCKSWLAEFFNCKFTIQCPNIVPKDGPTKVAE
jgi:hypothetical protein